MITKCLFCDYKKEKPLSRPILKVLTSGDLPIEDWILWIERLVQEHGTREYNSVKIHMGMKHKDEVYRHISPGFSLDKFETELVNGQLKGAK